MAKAPIAQLAQITKGIPCPKCASHPADQEPNAHAKDPTEDKTPIMRP